MDEEVHGFASDILPPLNTRIRSDMPFIPNGSNPKAFDPETKAFSEKKHHSKHKHHQRHNDISENNMEWEVHDFASGQVSPINEMAHAKDAPAMNGENAHASLHQSRHHKHPDINERKMDEEVHGFASEYTDGQNIIAHSDAAPAMNGADAHPAKAAFSQGRHHHRKHPDIAERKMDDEVHGFSSEYTDG